MKDTFLPKLFIVFQTLFCFIAVDDVTGRVGRLRELRDLYGLHLVGDPLHDAAQQHVTPDRQHW